MQRVTVSLGEEEAAAFDALSRERGYASRSEAVRDLVRRAVDARRLEGGAEGQCVANVSYVYDHHGSLAKRLTELQHDQPGLVVSTMHVHLDHHTCLESTILRGPTRAVRVLADAMRAARGVRFGAVNLVSVPHGHDHAALSPPTHRAA